LWRENPSDPIDIYQLNTITYGTASAPYLCIRCLHQVAHECDDETISRVIKEDFYVDDLLTSCDNKNDLMRICAKTSHLLSQYGFMLHKWTYNFDVTTYLKDFAIDEHTKTLGLGWHNVKDEFFFTTKLAEVDTLSLLNGKCCQLFLKFTILLAS
jgi:hypothetical protein